MDSKSLQQAHEFASDISLLPQSLFKKWEASTNKCHIYRWHSPLTTPSLAFKKVCIRENTESSLLLFLYQRCCFKYKVMTVVCTWNRISRLISLIQLLLNKNYVIVRHGKGSDTVCSGAKCYKSFIGQSFILSWFLKDCSFYWSLDYHDWWQKMIKQHEGQNLITTQFNEIIYSFCIGEYIHH